MNENTKIINTDKQIDQKTIIVPHANLTFTRKRERTVFNYIEELFLL